MKETIAEYIVPVTQDGRDVMFDFLRATELTRCRDCRWYEKDIGNDWGVCFHKGWTGGSIGHCVDAEVYCYRAERRGESS